MKIFLLLILAALSPALAHATTPPAAPIDLGEGLTYLRLRSLGDDTPAISNLKPGAVVLDVRHASANDETAATFGTALTQLANHRPLIVLVSPSTPRAVASVLEKSSARLLVLGTADARPKPTVAIQTTAEADRTAYDAFESGTALEKLISGKIEKERYDEATLVAEFKSGQALPVSEDPPAPASPADHPPAAAPAPPPTDRVLQRALHLHRALLALRP